MKKNGQIILYNFISVAFLIFNVVVYVNLMKYYTIAQSNISLFFVIISLLISMVIIFSFGKRISRLYAPFIDKWSFRKKNVFVISIFLLIFIFKVIFIISFNINQGADAGTFYNFAETLSRSWIVPENKYVAIFPHIYGYSSFSSIILKLFRGVPIEGITLLKIMNCILNMISAFLLYKIASKMMSFCMSFFCGVMYAIIPEMTIGNSQILSEPLYTVLLLCTIYFTMLFFEKKEKKVRDYVLFILMLGILFSWINSIRPIVSIIIIASIIFLVYLFYYNKTKMLKSLFVLLCIIMLTVIGGKINNYIISDRIQLNVTESVGWNLYVGANFDSQGCWNIEDGELFSNLMSKDTSVDDIQRYFTKSAFERYKSYNLIQLIKHFNNKIAILWGSGFAYVSYWGEKIGEFIYIFLWTGILITSLLTLKKRQSWLFFSKLYVLGLTAAHCIVEVAVRYHYSAIPFLVLIFIKQLDLYQKEKMI